MLYVTYELSFVFYTFCVLEEGARSMNESVDKRNILGGYAKVLK